MATLKVSEYLNKEKSEVLLEVTSGEATVHAYCYPFKGVRNAERIRLYGFQTWNIGPCAQWHKPQRGSTLGFGYHICAEIVNIRDRLVRLGDIEIILDAPLDREWTVGSFIGFDVSRLDY